MVVDSITRATNMTNTQTGIWTVGLVADCNPKATTDQIDRHAHFGNGDIAWSLLGRLFPQLYI
jgi:hypothetical protein